MVLALAGDSTITKFLGIVLLKLSNVAAKLHKKSDLHLIYIGKKRFLGLFPAIFQVSAYHSNGYCEPKDAHDSQYAGIGGTA